MIPKRHGPARRLEVINLAGCPACAGAGWIKGIWHDMPCASCNGAGLVNRETGEALPAEDLVIQLRLRLNRANRLLAHYESERPTGGPHADYTGKKNPAGIGGGNWTGD
ncbi:hypothetical protein [Metapseudomonas otitidis]|uniref:hypothetical protein n=1 Tax=Metapseudomonas otitidis TaxID=319939 RepID=UPI0013F61492|nr:hypothetical protein [Pseudomonas otitidis]